MNNALSGEPLSKQFSHSLITPSSITTYREFFRQNSIAENGFVEVAFDKSDQWTRKWMSYEESVLYFYESPISKSQNSFSVPMDKVISFRADTNNPEHPIVSVVTTDKKLRIRLSNLEEMRKWLFCFQKSVALVLTHILENRKSEVKEDSSVWLKDLGNGHGNGERSFYRSAVTRAFTLEDVPTNNYSSPRGDFSRTTSRMFADEGTASPAPPKLMAVSPAIPINFPVHLQQRAEEGEESFRRDRIASSYRNEDFSPLSEVMRQQPQRPQEDLDDDDQDDSQSAPPSDDDMMFDMDEHIEEKQSKQSHDKSKSTGSTSLGSTTGVAELLRQSRTTTPQSSSSSRHTTPRGSFSGSHTGLAGNILISGGVLKWDSGVCSKFGPREKNEDRFVVLPSCSHPPRQNNSFFDGSNPPTVPSTGGGGIHPPRPGVGPSSGGSKSLLSTSLEASNSNYLLPEGDTTYGYFAVYDGHAGDLAATYLQQHLHEKISRHKYFPTDIELAVFETFLEVDKEFLEICRRRNSAAGTTALGAVIVGSTLTVFNVGDSMAVLCSDGRPIEMSSAHKPNRPDENQRILQANGWILEEKELYMGRLHRIDYDDPVAIDKAKNMNWVTIYRVCGELALSRSIGDPDYKGFIPDKVTDAFFLWPTDHSKIFKADLVIPDPECKVHSLSSVDEFLILASDGLWDVVSPSEAVKFVQRAFQLNKSPTEVAEELTDLAIRLGSSDNVTIVIVRFIHS